MRFFPRTTHPPTRRRSPRRAQRLRLEALENRCLLAAGDLDPSFGTGGKVITDFGGFGILDVAHQADGRIVAVGAAKGTTVQDYSDFAVARYNSDGSLDTSFDGDGKVTTNFSGPRQDHAISVAVQPHDQKIVVAGFSVARDANFALARYNANGSLDKTFNKSGKVTTDFGASDMGSAVVIQADKKIIVAGSTGNEPFDLALARYNSDGRLDKTFGGDGKVTTAIGSARRFPVGIALEVQADGTEKIVVVASRQSFYLSAGDWIAVRYNSNGSLDESFDSDGIVTTSFGTAFQAPAAVAVTGGKIIAAGSMYTPFQPGREAFFSFALARYNTTDGSLDTTFGTDGKVTTIAQSDLSVGDVGIQKDGKIVVAGIALSDAGRGADFAVARYNTDGSLDAGFGPSSVFVDQIMVVEGDAGTTDAVFTVTRLQGVVTTDLGGSQGSVDGRSTSLAIDPSNGKLVVAGRTHDVPGSSISKFALARYEVAPDAAPPATATVDFVTADGTATAGSDYVAASGTLTFGPDETTKTITVAVIGDTVPESGEHFFVNLSNALGAVIARTQGKCQIGDGNDGAMAAATAVQESSSTGAVRDTLAVSSPARQDARRHTARMDAVDRAIASLFGNEPRRRFGGSRRLDLDTELFADIALLVKLTDPVFPGESIELLDDELPRLLAAPR